MKHEEVQRYLNENHASYVRFSEKTSVTRMLERINWLLFDSHLTQTEIANESDVSKPIINRLVRGKRNVQDLKLNTLEKLNNAALKHIEL